MGEGPKGSAPLTPLSLAILETFSEGKQLKITILESRYTFRDPVYIIAGSGPPFFF